MRGGPAQPEACADGCGSETQRESSQSSLAYTRTYVEVVTSTRVRCDLNACARAYARLAGSLTVTNFTESGTFGVTISGGGRKVRLKAEVR